MITIYQKHKRINSETLRKLLVTELESSLSIQKKQNVVKVTNVEPCDNEILSQMMQSDNIYQQIVHIMKQSTQEYYNYSKNLLAYLFVV